MENPFDFSEAVDYHYDRFPPQTLDFARIVKPLAKATSALARYDQMLKGMHNSEILLAPLRNREAVISSRIEGTVSTLDEVLRYEADQDGDAEETDRRYRNDTIEVALYARALRSAQRRIEEGAPLSSWLLRAAHAELLRLGRGAGMTPGAYKTEQNYLADRGQKKILFVPISPERLDDGMERLLAFANENDTEILIKSALSHLEFEALHPFKDGNGRIGRMLITLMLWKNGLISAPHFYVSAYFEQHRDAYIDKMRAVSKDDAWTDWVIFFLEAIENQAQQNLIKAEEIRSLYEEMKERFREILASQWSLSALDFIFSRPIFRNNKFTAESGIPSPTAQRFTRALCNAGLLRIIIPPAGRRPAMYAFEPLLAVVRA